MEKMMAPKIFSFITILIFCLIIYGCETTEIDGPRMYEGKNEYGQHCYLFMNDKTGDDDSSVLVFKVGIYESEGDSALEQLRLDVDKDAFLKILSKAKSGSSYSLENMISFENEVKIFGDFGVELAINVDGQSFNYFSVIFIQHDYFYTRYRCENLVLKSNNTIESEPEPDAIKLEE